MSSNIDILAMLLQLNIFVALLLSVDGFRWPVEFGKTLHSAAGDTSNALTIGKISTLSEAEMFASGRGPLFLPQGDSSIVISSYDAHVL